MRFGSCMAVLLEGMCPGTLHEVDYFPKKEEKYNCVERGKDRKI